MPIEYSCVTTVEVRRFEWESLRVSFSTNLSKRQEYKIANKRSIIIDLIIIIIVIIVTMKPITWRSLAEVTRNEASCRICRMRSYGRVDKRGLCRRNTKTYNSLLSIEWTQDISDILAIAIVENHLDRDLLAAAE